MAEIKQIVNYGTSIVSPTVEKAIYAEDGTRLDNKLTAMNESITECSKATTFYEGTLAAGATSLTISNSAITTDSILDIYTSIYGVNPKTVTIANGSVTMAFTAQSAAMSVKVRCM